MVCEKNIVGFWNQAEVIKMCPLVLELKKSKKLDTKVCVTGQCIFRSNSYYSIRSPNSTKS